MVMKKNPIHYYEDGDVVLQAEGTHFLVHKPFLSLASQFFKDLFAQSKPNSNETVKNTNANESEASILVLEIMEENANSIQDMLSFIYPNVILDINWENVENLFRIANKFKIKKLTNSCDLFLQNNLIENILTTFKLAELYRLPIPFKEASKLILNDFLKYECDSEYIQIPKRARDRLGYSRFVYHTFLDKLSWRLGSKGYNKIQTVCVYPTRKPSFVYNELNSFNINFSDKEAENKAFYKSFKEYLMKFERSNKRELDMNFYSFVELEDE
ncbi:161_t:CDS:1 [Funneliformis mosseae]|uniref:161_t:CDS:1 n=1 Tax=Funneliformis mosseae TaxID=27381 RepID=A0A9N8YRB0_FUNMO|nr:161_t:CDS:1 [Funneliformis mosseae]